MAALLYLKLTNRLACQGAQAVYGVLRPHEITAASDVRAVEDQETLTFRFTRLDASGAVRPIAAQMRAGRVVTVVWDDGSFEEWRVGPVATGRGERGLITVSCVPLWLDLVERADAAAGRGWVSELTAGLRDLEYEITERTASSILSTYVIPNAPSWVTLGTVDPTYVIPSLTVSRLTPGGLAIAVRDALRTVDIPCELRLRRNGTTDYKLDLVTQIGAGGATPVFHPSNSLLELHQRTDPTLQATRILVRGATAPDGLPGIWGRARWRCAAPVGSTIVLTDRNGGAGPIGFDGQFVGMYLLRVKTGRTFLISASSASAGTVTLTGGVSSITADEDFEFRLTEPLTNTRTTTTRYAITSTAGSAFTMSGNPITADSQYVDWYARVWTAASGGTIVTTTRISASVAATDVATVASTSGASTAHFVEFVQLDGAGEIPSMVDHPTYIQADPVGYGVKTMELGKPQAGVAQLVPNAWMRTWTNGANPPDGWTFQNVLTTATFSRNSAAAYTRYGGYSTRFEIGFSGSSGELAVITPTTYVNYTSGQTALSCRALVYFDTTTAVGKKFTLTVYALTGAGARGASLGEVAIFPAGTTPTNPYSGTYAFINAGTWLELAVKGITIGPSTAPYGVIGVFACEQYGTTFDIYVDSIEMYPFAECPNAPTEFGDATGLLQAANNQLRLVATPPLFYTFDIRDLERAFPTEFSRLAVTLGANARAADVEYGIDTTVRVLRIERDLKKPTQTSLTLANRPTLLTSVQSAGTAATRSVISAIVTGQSSAAALGAAFASVTGAVTLPENAEIATASTTTGTISLGPNSAILYKPPDSTAPTTGVTAGAPPSRRMRPPLLPNF